MTEQRCVKPFGMETEDSIGATPRRQRGSRSNTALDESEVASPVLQFRGRRPTRSPIRRRTRRRSRPRQSRGRQSRISMPRSRSRSRRSRRSRSPSSRIRMSRSYRSRSRHSSHKSREKRRRLRTPSPKLATAIVETGDEPAACGTRRTLVLANHQSTADVPMLMAAWNPRPGLLPNLMWIMDRVFKFTNFGIVSVLHEDFFIQAGKAQRDKSLEQLKVHIHKFYVPLGRQFVVLFPEGGFLHKRREISQRFAKKNGLPQLEYVSLPRAGAMKVIMEHIGPHRDTSGASTSKDITKQNNLNQNKVNLILDTNCGETIQWILDVTIAYPDRKPLHLWDVVCGIRPACTTHLHYRLYNCDEVPNDTEGMTNWLYDRFIEKDKMLEEFYRTGSFPTKGDTPLITRPVRQDNLRYIILHSFFIASTYIQYKFFTYLFSFVW